MKITCVVVGKIKEKYFTDAIKEYSKRLGRYCKLEIVELADEKTPDGASEAEELAIREKEGERILKALKDDAYVIALAIEGKMLDSVELSQKDRKPGDQRYQPHCFCDWRFLRPGSGCDEAGGLCFKLFPYDLSPSAHAGGTAGTALPELSDYEKRTLS